MNAKRAPAAHAVPEHSLTTKLIEAVPGVNEESDVSGVGHVDGRHRLIGHEVLSHRERWLGAEVEVAAGFQDTFRHQSAVDFADAHGSCSWLLVKCDKATGHESTVGCPWGMFVCNPSCHVSHLCAQELRLRAVAQEPVTQIDSIGAAGANRT